MFPEDDDFLEEDPDDPPTLWRPSFFLFAAYVALCLYSPFMSDYWADLYRGSNPPYPENARGEVLFNRILKRNGYTGKPRPPEAGPYNFYYMLQPYCRVWKYVMDDEGNPIGGGGAYFADRKDPPLLEVSIVAPEDGKLVGTDKFQVSVSGTLLQTAYSANRPGALLVTLDGVPRHVEGGLFSIPSNETSFTLSGALPGSPGNGLHHVEVQIVAMDVPAEVAGRAGNVTVTASVVFFLFHYSEDQEQQWVDVPPSAANSAAAVRMLPPLRLLTPRPESIVEGSSFSVTAVAPSVPRLHILLRIDAEVHDVTALVRVAAEQKKQQLQGQRHEGEEGVEFSVQVHGASSGFHTVVLTSVLLSEADEAAGIDATSLVQAEADAAEGGTGAFTGAFDAVRFQCQVQDIVGV